MRNQPDTTIVESEALMKSTGSESLQWVCEQYPQRVRELFEGLDPDNPRLTEVCAAAHKGEWVEACRLLLEYYRTSGGGQWLRYPTAAGGAVIKPGAELMADDYFPLPGNHVRIPRLLSGQLNWAYVPPEQGGMEWSFGINRHDYMVEIVAAFFATGDRKYVRSLNRQLFDWIATINAPDAQISECPWGTILEVGHRCKAWPAVFYGLLQETEFSPATRILLLSQALDHGRFLHKFHAGGSNWIITEMAGLLSVAVSWPEFIEAAEWEELALRLAEDELVEQVYPDGTQKELSSNYQWAVLGHMSFFVDTVRGAGLSVSPRLTGVMEKMWNQLAFSLSPNGHAPHNGDSDRYTATEASTVIQPPPVASAMLNAAHAYNRADWLYILSNGTRGQRPAGLPSVLFPWAGQLISRSGWDAEAHWSYFDIGPWGTLHQHNDALHLSVTAYGRDLLVDSGRYTYENYLGEPGSWRSYFTGSRSHNTILVDGCGQVDGPTLAESPIGEEQAVITPEYDYAQGTFAGGYADVATVSARLKAVLWRQPDKPEAQIKARHTRGVLYIRGLGWIVVDRVEVDQARRISALWHFHPDCTVMREGRDVVSMDKGVGNLRIQPLSSQPWMIELVSGQEEPDFQGWYSPEMDVRDANVCAIYSLEIQEPVTIVWLLMAGKDTVPSATVKQLQAPEGAVHLQLGGIGEHMLEVAIRLNSDMPLHLASGEALTGNCAIRRHETTSGVSAD